MNEGNQFAKTEKGRVAEEYLAKYPKMFKRKLARLMVRERPDLYKDSETARSFIRYYTGANGDQHAKYTTITQRNASEPMQSIMQKYYLDAEVNQKRNPIKIEGQKVGIISDLHIPYHVMEAVETALEYIEKKGIDTLLINGDLVDFYQVSSFNKDPRRASLEYERDMCMEFFEFLRHAFGDIKIYYKIGNHEERFDHFMQKNAPELYGMEEFNFETMMHLDEYDIELIQGKQKSQIGKLDCIHGHEFGRSFFNPVNPARGLFLRAKSTCLAGHNHQTSEHHENNLKDDSIACWSTGCLCDLQPEYRVFAYTKWNHGAAHVEVYDDGTFLVDNFRIIDGKVR